MHLNPELWTSVQLDGYWLILNAKKIILFRKHGNGFYVAGELYARNNIYDN